jgi:hypothetical protein
MMGKKDGEYWRCPECDTFHHKNELERRLDG